MEEFRIKMLKTSKQFNYQSLITTSTEIISTSNHMFGRAIWDKLLEYNFEIFEIARVKRGQFQNFQNHVGDLFQKSPKPNVITG